MVGPFIFFDQMGPAEFLTDQESMCVPTHINLATVTYLFEGQILHRDSLGTEQTIEPGAVNWMRAGRGIVHSERTSPDRRRSGQRLFGIQTWMALPEGRRRATLPLCITARSSCRRSKPKASRRALIWDRRLARARRSRPPPKRFMRTCSLPRCTAPDRAILRGARALHDCG